MVARTKNGKPKKKKCPVCGRMIGYQGYPKHVSAHKPEEGTFGSDTYHNALLENPEPVVRGGVPRVVDDVLIEKAKWLETATETLNGLETLKAEKINELEQLEVQIARLKKAVAVG